MMIIHDDPCPDKGMDAADRLECPEQIALRDRAMDPGNDTYVWDRAPEKFAFIVGEAANAFGDNL
jgi:hypothetical protein